VIWIFPTSFFVPSKRRANKEKGAAMLEFLRKSMLAGIGAAVLTRDKIREREWGDMSSKLQSSVKKISENLEMVRKKEFADLQARVELLEQRLSVLEEARGKESGLS
jgi:hypothetical protein